MPSMCPNASQSQEFRSENRAGKKSCVRHGLVCGLDMDWQAGALSPARGHGQLRQPGSTPCRSQSAFCKNETRRFVIRATGNCPARVMWRDPVLK